MLNIGKKIGKIPKSEADIEEAKVKKRRNVLLKEKAENEAKVAYFCLHASRLHSQISSFLEKNLHVRNIPHFLRPLDKQTQDPEPFQANIFLCQGEDMLEKIRADVADCNKAYKNDFKEVVPTLDLTG